MRKKKRSFKKEVTGEYGHVNENDEEEYSSSNSSDEGKSNQLVKEQEIEI